mgnify:CR=1 FL=1|jgi:hypothetical protein
MISYASLLQIITSIYAGAVIVCVCAPAEPVAPGVVEPEAPGVVDAEVPDKLCE